jgi:hypothetical protein
MSDTDSKIELRSPHFHALEQTPPPVLYHYTDQAGLIGILATGELWATKIQYMNDGTEFEHALKLATAIVDQRTEGLENEEDKEILKKGLSFTKSMRLSNICSVSFCEDPDLLSQWRGYATSGTGYSIGFRSDALSSIGEGGPEKCVYDEADQSKIINELIDDTMNHKRVNNRKTLLRGAFGIELTRFATFFKNATFREENEWRLTVGPKHYTDKEFSFRPGKSMLIPYYALKIAGDSWKNKIDEVVVGPCPHPELSTTAVNGLLVRYSVNRDGNLGELLGYPRVRSSSIPYRNW